MAAVSTDIDAMLDRQRFLDAVEACTDNVSVRPPIAGMSYAAFAVHPPRPGPVVLAIGHRADGKYIVDLVDQYLTVAAAAAVLHPYGVTKVIGAESNTIDEDGHVHAVAGLISVLWAQEETQ